MFYSLVSPTSFENSYKYYALTSHQTELLAEKTFCFDLVNLAAPLLLE